MILKIKVYLFMKYKYTVKVYFFWKETSMKNIVNLDDLSLDEINDERRGGVSWNKQKILRIKKRKN